MRYQSVVTDFVQQPALTRLGAVETRLAGVLGRPRRLAIACVAALSLCGWLALGLMAAGANAPGWQALCRISGAGDWSDLAVTMPMWAAMTLAMMLPTAGPMILTYAEIADTAAGKGEPAASPLILAAGYAAVWLGFALAAGMLQVVLAHAGLIEGDRLALPFAGMLVVGAGLYQFSALKHACLTLCQRPFPFFFANWTDEPAGVFRLGLRQGLYCLGCCAALMLLMFAIGVMNVVWMALLGIVMTIEKMSTTTRFGRAAGVVMIASGAGLIAASMVV
jgi:predicted metal-binding membrane protein